MDDRSIANIVNTVRDIAINFHTTEQLRARIAHVLVPQLKRIAELEAAEEGAKHAFGDVVQQKRDLEAEVARLRGLLDGAHAAVKQSCEQARQEERAKVIEQLGDMADNARDNGYPLAVEALHEAIDMLEADNGKAEASTTEVLGERCIDGGKCHHHCTDRCFRREACAPFSDYSGPWAYPDAAMKGGA